MLSILDRFLVGSMKSPGPKAFTEIRKISKNVERLEQKVKKIQSAYL